MTVLRHTWIALGLALAAMVFAVQSAQAQAFHFSEAERPAFETEIILATPPNTGVEENWFRMNGDLQVRNVRQATLVPFLPPRHLATGEVIIVAPGGGFLGLNIRAEGYDVAEALASHGIAAFVLKYRLVETPADFDVFTREMVAGRSGKPSTVKPPADTPAESLADAKAALLYVHDHAADWGIDPDQIGMMGFSAGAFLTLSVGLDDDAPVRPSFIAPIYPRMQARDVPGGAPPMFVAIASDDFFLNAGDLGLIESWLTAGRPVEFHLFDGGGHGFGLGRAGTRTTGWLDQFVGWLRQLD